MFAKTPSAVQTLNAHLITMQASVYVAQGSKETLTISPLVVILNQCHVTQLPNARSILIVMEIPADVSFYYSFKRWIIYKFYLFSSFLPI